VPALAPGGMSTSASAASSLRHAPFLLFATALPIVPAHCKCKGTCGIVCPKDWLFWTREQGAQTGLAFSLARPLVSANSICSAATRIRSFMCP